ncbi:MAG: phage major capsid protein [Deltaproteobacteria bacterium]|nr:phage major capsid protein [Deltaproteobacteria bacterium]TLN01420.1 MAG: phage major capsid protein [bacterium]
MSITDEVMTAFDQFKAVHTSKLDEIQSRIDGIEGAKNRAAFGAGGSFSGNAEQEAHKGAFLAFARKGIDSGLRDLEIQASMSTGSDPDGGYGVPTVIDSEIEKLLLDLSPMRQICKVIPVSTPDYKKLVNTGGLASGWVGETQARPETDTPQLAILTPFMGEIYANPAATQQSLDDMSFDVESFLQEGIADEFADQEGAAFITGDGILKPKGLLTYPTATTADATRPFGTLQYFKSGDASGFVTASATVSPADCLISLIYGVRKAYRKGSVFLMNSNTLSVISKFKDAVNGLPIWRQSLTEGQPSTLLGYPVEEDENMPDIGANAFPIAFGNFKRGFTIVDRMGTRVLRDAFTNKPYVHFYSTRRVGTFLNNSQAIKLLKIEAA